MSNNKNAGGSKHINKEQKSFGLHPNNQISAILRLVAVLNFSFFSLHVQSFIFTL